MRWRPYVDGAGHAYGLSHLHPFRFEVDLEARAGLAARTVHVHVGFGMHCFTRKAEDGDDSGRHYADDRETRTFSPERYQLSRELPKIVRTLGLRRCGFAKDDNYVTVDLPTVDGQSIRYAVFFNVKAWKERGQDSVLLVVQSAYVLSAGKPNPGKGRVGFNVLLGNVLRGVKPRKPR